MRLVFCTAFFLCVTSLYAQTQTDSLFFGVYHGSKKVGMLRAIQATTGKRTVYTIYSQVDVNLLLDISITEFITDVYENGILLSVNHTRTVNGSERAHNITKRQGNIYKLFRNGEEEEDFTKPITVTVSSIYFQEPSSVSEIYSQSHQRLIPVKVISSHVYELDLPNSDTTIFHYKNGVLQLVTAHTFWGTVHFKKENLN